MMNTLKIYLSGQRVLRWPCWQRWSFRDSSAFDAAIKHSDQLTNNRVSAYQCCQRRIWHVFEATKNISKSKSYNSNHASHFITFYRNNTFLTLLHLYYFIFIVVNIYKGTSGRKAISVQKAKKQKPKSQVKFKTTMAIIGIPFNYAPYLSTQKSDLIDLIWCCLLLRRSSVFQLLSRHYNPPSVIIHIKWYKYIMNISNLVYRDETFYWYHKRRVDSTIQLQFSFGKI